MTTATFEQSVFSAIESAKQALINQSAERDALARNTVYFPVYAREPKDLSKTRGDSEITSVMVVRRTNHANGTESFLLAFEYWSYGKRLTREELIAKGFGYTDSYTGKTRSQVNPFSGYRVAYRKNAQGETVLIRVNKDGVGQTNLPKVWSTMTLADKAIRQALFWESFAQRNAMAYPDMRVTTFNLDRHMKHNNAVTEITQNVPSLTVEPLREFATMSDEDFAKAFDSL